MTIDGAGPYECVASRSRDNWSHSVLYYVTVLRTLFTYFFVFTLHALVVWLLAFGFGFSDVVWEYVVNRLLNSARPKRRWFTYWLVRIFVSLDMNCTVAIVHFVEYVRQLPGQYVMVNDKD